jgi:hypothetical protein
MNEYPLPLSVEERGEREREKERKKERKRKKRIQKVSVLMWGRSAFFYCHVLARFIFAFSMMYFPSLYF